MRIHYLNYNPQLIINNNFNEVNIAYSSCEVIENIKLIFKRLSNMCICFDHPDDKKKIKNFFLFLKIVYIVFGIGALFFGSIPLVCICSTGILAMHISEKKFEKFIKV